jgi:hypothetical protein
VRTAASATFSGSVHDTKGFDRTGVAVPPGVTAYRDTADLGTGLKTPRGSPRGALTPGRRLETGGSGGSGSWSSPGVGKRKVWRAAAERWRNPAGVTPW